MENINFILWIPVVYYIWATKISQMKLSEEQFSLVMYKNYVMTANQVPTIASQSYTSLCVLIVREVRAAVGTYPVSVTNTSELITANLKSKVNQKYRSTLIQKHEKSALISNCYMPRIWWYWKIISTFFLRLISLFQVPKIIFSRDQQLDPKGIMRFNRGNEFTV